MNCRLYRDQLIEHARGAPPAPALAAHLDTCRECARLLDAQLALTAALGELAAAAPAPPASLEARLAAEFDRAARRRRMLRWTPAAIAAALALAGFLRFGAHPKPAPIAAPPAVAALGPQTAPLVAPAAKVETPRPVKRRPAVRRPRRPAPAQPEPFIAIPYTEPLAPYERAAVVRMDLPMAAIIAAGLPVAPADPSAQARADVLVSQDGRARAIRLVSISNVIPERRMKP